MLFYGIIHYYINIYHHGTSIWQFGENYPYCTYTEKKFCQNGCSTYNFVVQNGFFEVLTQAFAGLGCTYILKKNVKRLFWRYCLSLSDKKFVNLNISLLILRNKFTDHHTIWSTHMPLWCSRLSCQPMVQRTNVREFKPRLFFCFFFFQAKILLWTIFCRFNNAIGKGWTFRWLS